MPPSNSYHSGPYQPLTEDVVTLNVRQHPVQAVVTPENKEKMRKPVDPPPIIQLQVSQTRDSGSNYLVNPYLFMTATLCDTDDNEMPKNDQLVGSFVSSLHRLKDIDNRDGGFFVFGDISCRREGRYKLLFSLFELREEGTHLVCNTYSNDFDVLPLKEFRGLRESTHLSRAFSDQGVRLRLRKEPRSAKRAWNSDPDVLSPTQAYGAAHRHYSYDYGMSQHQPKRQRCDSEITGHTPFSAPPMMGGPVSQPVASPYGMYPPQTTTYTPQPQSTAYTAAAQSYFPDVTAQATAAAAPMVQFPTRATTMGLLEGTNEATAAQEDPLSGYGLGGFSAADANAWLNGFQ